MRSNRRTIPLLPARLRGKVGKMVSVRGHRHQHHIGHGHDRGQRLSHLYVLQFRYALTDFIDPFSQQVQREPTRRFYTVAEGQDFLYVIQREIQAPRASHKLDPSHIRDVIIPVAVIQAAGPIRRRLAGM